MTNAEAINEIMTNEQIIQKLKVFRDNGKVLLDPCLIDKDKLWKEMAEVFDMAIKALEAQEWVPVSERLPGCD